MRRSASSGADRRNVTVHPDLRTSFEVFESFGAVLRSRVQRPHLVGHCAGPLRWDTVRVLLRR
jgi:hypothetical protein